MSAISTPAGTICLRVDYRTSMTIAPMAGGSCSSGTAAPYFISATGSGSGGDTASNTSNSASGTATGTQPIMMKSDHFHFAAQVRGNRCIDGFKNVIENLPS